MLKSAPLSPHSLHASLASLDYLAYLDNKKNNKKMKGTRIGRKLFLSVLSLFVVFAVLFIAFQQLREKEYKIEKLNLRLQDYNLRMHDALAANGLKSGSQIDAYVKAKGMDELRVTLIDTKGRVTYDTNRKDYQNMGNHGSRKEVKDALRRGYGYDISRPSHTLSGEYFYSATYFKDDRIIVRSALPYDETLANSLAADQHYIWFALIVVVLLSIVLYRFINRLDSNISKLRAFAQRADRSESVKTEDLVEFSDDELGEISEHIIKLYKRLQDTKEEQNQLKRQLTQNIAHELKTPVASIQGYLETIKNNPDISAPIRTQFLDRCYAQTLRLASLLRDISTLNRLDDGSTMVDVERVDISAIAKQVANETALQLYEREMRIDNRLPDGIEVEGNQSLLYSVFRNLTDNAIAYAGEGTTIKIEAYSTDDHWHFTFSDNGVGVAASHLDRLFERFYRVDKGRSRKLGGTGLGLAIVKNAVLFHGGEISASNNPDGGLRFDFSISKIRS